MQVIELLCRSAECENPVEKSKLEKGSLHDRATSLPEQHRLLANRLTESLGLSTMQIRSSRTGRMSRHFSHDLPLSASKPSTRPLPPQGLGRRVVRQSAVEHHNHASAMCYSGKSLVNKGYRRTNYLLVTMDICPCQSNYVSTAM